MSKSNLWEQIGINEYTFLDSDEVLELFNRWREQFCPELNLKHKNRFFWENIAGARCDDATNLYVIHDAPHYYIMTEPYKGSIQMITTTNKLLYVQRSLELYVFPKNMAWCMCMTHEDGWLGPIFSKHSDYKKLHKKNSEACLAIASEKTLTIPHNK